MPCTERVLSTKNILFLSNPVSNISIKKLILLLALIVVADNISATVVRMDFSYGGGASGSSVYRIV